MKKLLVILAALAFSTSLALAEPHGHGGGDRGGDRGGHMDRGHEGNGGMNRGGFHRGFHGGMNRGLYIGNPCWDWEMPFGWIYVCD
jgi:hypothetical protein